MTYSTRFFVNGTEVTPTTWHVSESFFPRIGDIVIFGELRARVHGIEWHYDPKHTDVFVLMVK